MRHELTIDQRLAIALDTGDQEQALEWARAVKGIFGVAKVGLQLFSAQGPAIVGHSVVGGGNSYSVGSWYEY